MQQSCDAEPKCTSLQRILPHIIPTINVLICFKNEIKTAKI